MSRKVTVRAAMGQKEGSGQIHQSLTYGNLENNSFCCSFPQLPLRRSAQRQIIYPIHQVHICSLPGEHRCAVGPVPVRGHLKSVCVLVHVCLHAWVGGCECVNLCASLPSFQPWQGAWLSSCVFPHMMDTLTF